MRKIILLSLLLTACGGGGGGSTAASGSTPTGWTSGVYKPASTFAAQCAVPRTGIDPSTGTNFPDRAGTVLTQNNWLRSWSNNLYLWYADIVDRDPANYTTSSAYFDLLKSTQSSPTGHPKDRFHFTYPTDQWIALSRSGVQASYGAQWSFISTTPPRKLVVAYIEASSPAESAGLARGAEVLFVDGVDLVNDNTQSGVNALNAGISPAAVGETHQFIVHDAGGAGNRSISMQSQNVTAASVQNLKSIMTQTGNVGYMQFNDHLATAEQALVDAITALKAANISDLVLDIRYNGGGFLDVASELAYMIAGDAPTAGKSFEQAVFNDKYSNSNPVTGATLAPEPFLNKTVGLGQAPAGQALPTLNLARVFVITGPDTCSASEALINGLRGADVEVIQIGETTCGKPYGFYPQDNCGTTYFTIEFKGVNAKGFGDYSDGFSPTATPSAGAAEVQGCVVLDDFSRPLGDENEARLSAALAYRLNPGCPAPASGLSKPGAGSLVAAHGRLVRSPLLENRIMR